MKLRLIKPIMLAMSAGLVFASCSSASNNPVSTVNGYIAAARSGNVASMCSYAITDEQGACVMMYSMMFQIAGGGAGAVFTIWFALVDKGNESRIGGFG